MQSRLPFLESRRSRERARERAEAEQGGERDAASSEDGAALDDQRELVSVVLPAYNAERFLDETLWSVRRQTYANLEIIVVDDGSTDATPEIARKHADADPRVSLIQQPNGGVGSARNTGIRHAKGRYVAPIDADDLWRPTKIARQMDALAASTGKAGLVYTWFAVIDEHGRVLSARTRPVIEGDVLGRMCLGNLTGNASSALMPRDVVLEMGGYDETLHAQDAQGCEDLKLYWAIAERYQFVCVPDRLTGYRIGEGNMSNNFLRMLRSFDVVMSSFSKRRPDLADEFHRGRVETLRWLAIRALRAGAFRDASWLLQESWRYDWFKFIVSVVRMPAYFARIALEGRVRAFKEQLFGPPDRYLPNGQG